jgi:hypothetical protein
MRQATNYTLNVSKNAEKILQQILAENYQIGNFYIIFAVNKTESESNC